MSSLSILVAIKGFIRNNQGSFFNPSYFILEILRGKLEKFELEVRRLRDAFGFFHLRSRREVMRPHAATEDSNLQRISIGDRGTALLKDQL
jgi:hypothetical protein